MSVWRRNSRNTGKLNAVDHILFPVAIPPTEVGGLLRSGLLWTRICRNHAGDPSPVVRATVRSCWSCTTRLVGSSV